MHAVSDSLDQNLPDDTPARPEPGERELVLHRKGHRYTFRYRRGEEREVLDALSAMAENPDHDIGWYDAAVLSHGVGVSLREIFQELVKH